MRFAVQPLALLAALAISACQGPPMRPHDPTPGAVHFRLETYNVLFEHVAGDTLEAVGADGAEIVALEEVTAAWEDALRARWSDAYPHMLFNLAGGAGGLAVLSVYPLTDGGFHDNPEGFHPAWHVVADTPAGPVQVLVVHLRSVFSGDGSVIESHRNVSRDHQRSIQLYVDDCVPDMPTLVAGDFNEGPDGAAVTYLEDHGYTDVLPLFHPGQPTWRHRSLAGQLDEQLDHILYDDHFAPLDAWVRSAGSSDHLPLTAHFEVVGSSDASPGAN